MKDFRKRLLSGILLLIVSSVFAQGPDGELIGSTEVAFGNLIYKSNLGVKQVHTGLELDFILRPIDKLDIKGFASVGNWKY